MNNILQLLHKYAKSAEGIPDRSDYGDLSKLSPEKLYSMVLHKHDADKAQLHYDLRLGDKDTGLYSWAVRKGMPAPGNKHLAVMQPLHNYDYGTYEGTIPEGYGKGDVSIEDSGNVMFTKVTPSLITFITASKRNPEKFSLIKTKNNDWLLLNSTKTSTEDIDLHKKEHYKLIDESQVDDLLSKGYGASKKIDGALALYRIYKDKVEAMSYRKSKNGNPILYTPKVGGMYNMDIPKEFVGDLLKGEVFAQQNNQTIPAQELSGLLNSNIDKAVQTKADRKLKIKNALFGVVQSKNLSNPTHAEQREYLERVVEALGPSFMLPPSTEDPKVVKKWLKDMHAGVDPLTNEGLVLKDPKSTAVPVKMKLQNESDALITDVFPAKDGLAGGFVIADPKDSSISLGRVGTGFTDEMRRDMLANKEKYIGRIARINSQQQYASGKHRGPSFEGLHEDY